MVWKGVPMKKLLFIVNPRAGKTKSRAPLFDAVAQFSRAGYLVRVYITEAGGQARDITARWGGQYDMVVCAGGEMSSDIHRAWVNKRLPQVYFVPGMYSSDNAIGVSILAAREAGLWLK